MGALFLVSVCNYFFPFMQQRQLSESATTFMTGLAISGYLFPLIKVVELLAGLALLTGRFVALAAVVIFPITLNILLYHVFLDPGGILMAGLLFGGNIFLAIVYRDRYKMVFAAK